MLYLEGDLLSLLFVSPYLSNKGNMDRIKTSSLSLKYTGEIFNLYGHNLYSLTDLGKSHQQAEKVFG